MLTISAATAGFLLRCDRRAKKPLTGRNGDLPPGMRIAGTMYACADTKDAAPLDGMFLTPNERPGPPALCSKHMDKILMRKISLQCMKKK